MIRPPDRTRCELVLPATHRECGAEPVVGCAEPKSGDEGAVITLCADHLVAPFDPGYTVSTFPPGA